MSLYRQIAGLVRERVEKSPSFVENGKTYTLMPPMRDRQRMIHHNTIMAAHDIAERAGVSEIFDLATILAAMEIKFEEIVCGREQP